MKERPFIHLFRIGRRFFFYDVNKNQIEEIPEYVYRYLSTSEEGDGQEEEKVQEYVQVLQEAGFLKSSRPQVSEHPVTEYYGAFADNNVGQLTLQVTQKCNLDCEYCIYSGNYHNRHHADRWMTFETARKAIDYLAAHCADVETPSLGFYGGEPLLAYDLMKECTLYAEKVFEGRKFLLNFTTNGTLLTEDKVDFFVQHGFTMLISLDGPEHVQNRHRKFANSEVGSFKLLMTNVENMKKRYPVFFKENVTFNTVIDPQDPFTEICDFALHNDVVRDSFFMSSIVNDTYADEKTEYSAKFTQEYAYEKFKTFLMMTGRLDKSRISPVMREHFSRVKQIAMVFERYQQETIPYKGHRGGPCIPGVRKLFVTVDGRLYPCERVSESSQAGVIGDLTHGIDEEKALSVLNIERISSERCRNCWGYAFCNLCIAQADDGQKMTECKLCMECSDCKMGIESSLMDYVILREFGYNHEIY